MVEGAPEDPWLNLGAAAALAASALGLGALAGSGTTAAVGDAAGTAGTATVIDLAGESYGAVGTVTINGNIATANITAVSSEGGGGLLNAMTQLQNVAASNGADTLVLNANATYNTQLGDILISRYGGVVTNTWEAGGTIFRDITVVLPLK